MAVTGAVFAVAAAVRLGFVATSGGGFTGDWGYDASVYFAASDALTHGRVPYADFTLLHPPLLMLVLTPFAWLARLIGDNPAFVTANVFMCLVAAANAALVSAIALAWGLGRRAALIGGLFYGVWFGAAIGEFAARLEPLATFLFLGAIFVAARGGTTTTRRRLLVVGALLGLTLTVKIWWVAPVGVLVLWRATVGRDVRGAITMVAGALGAAVVVVAPFAVLAPSDMLRMIVTAQVGRSDTNASTVLRVLHLASLLDVPTTGDLARVLVIAVTIVAVALAWRAWLVPAARPIVAVAVVQVAVLLLSPSYFTYYSAYTPAAVSLIVAAAARPLPVRSGTAKRLTAAALPVGAVLVAALVTASTLTGITPNRGPKPLAVGPLPQQVESVRCLMADTPMALIRLNALTRGLANGCPNWVDVSGRTYDVDAPKGKYVKRRKNLGWQASIKRYLYSGQAYTIIRSETGYSPATLAELRSMPVMAGFDRVLVYRTR